MVAVALSLTDFVAVHSLVRGVPGLVGTVVDQPSPAEYALLVAVAQVYVLVPVGVLAVEAH